MAGRAASAGGLASGGMSETVRLMGALPPGLADLLPGAGAREDRERPGLLVLGTVGEPDRLLLHRLVRRRTTHLLLRYLDGGVVLGPYVVPGVTPCLGCLDAHADSLSPVPIARPVGLPDPVDVTTAGGATGPLAAVAAGWLACDIARHRAGERPTTWSATVELAPGLASITCLEWLRHPDCACAWPTDSRMPSDRSATMGP